MVVLGFTNGRRDRILWGTSDQVKCIHYADAKAITFAEHKPVHASFLLNITHFSSKDVLVPSLDEHIPADPPLVETKSNQIEGGKSCMDSSEVYDVIGDSGRLRLLTRE